MTIYSKSPNEMTLGMLYFPRMLDRIFWASVVFVCTATFAVTVEPQHANINMLNWLAGSWKGEAFGGTAEEIWSQPVGGTMMGMFRLIDHGKVAFSEFEEIVEQDNLLIFKVKHFTPAFVGWRKKKRASTSRFYQQPKKKSILMD